MLEYPTGVILDGDELVIGDPDLNAIVRIGDVAGMRTVVHQGPPLRYPSDLALAGVAIQVPSLSPVAIFALMLLMFASTKLRHRFA